jgi:hypothetical protein
MVETPKLHFFLCYGDKIFIFYFFLSVMTQHFCIFASYPKIVNENCKMKKLIVLFLCIASGLTSCSKEPSAVYNYGPEPARVTFEAPDGRILPMIETVFGAFYLPELLTDLKYGSGQLLTVSFTVDWGNQLYSDVVTASNFVVHDVINKIDTREVNEAGLVDDYTDIIVGAAYLERAIGNILFFGFSHNAPKGQTYTYEALYNPDEDENKVTVYFRAKKGDTISGTDEEIGYPVGIDISSLIETYKNKELSQVAMYFKVKTGEGENEYTDMEGSINVQIAASN